MTQRSFDDAFWNDPYVQELDKGTRLLFIYLWTNRHCNSAGLYEITLKTIAFDTGLPQNDLPGMFDKLKLKVKWAPECNIVWVKNFVKRQPKSPYFLKAVARCLPNISNNGMVAEFLSYYKSFGIQIPIEEGIERVSIPSRVCTDQDKDIDKDIDKEIIMSGKQLKKYPKEYNDLRRQVFVGLKQRREYVSRKPAAEAVAISKMLEEGFPPNQILEAYDIIDKQPFFRDKALSMMHVYNNIHEVLKVKHSINGGSDDELKKGVIVKE